MCARIIANNHRELVSGGGGGGGGFAAFFVTQQQKTDIRVHSILQCSKINQYVVFYVFIHISIAVYYNMS